MTKPVSFIVLTLIVLMMLTGCSTYRTLSRDPLRASIADATYRGIYEYPIQLQGGTYLGEPFTEGSASRPQVRLADRLITMGELDSTPGAEAAVILTENSGGSGSFVYLAVLREHHGEMINIATEFIGDRVQVMSLQIDNQQVVLDLAQHGSEDPNCCPTHIATRRWRLEGEKLVGRPNPYAEDSRLSLTVLEGQEFRLTQFYQGRPVPAGVIITLRIENGRFVGSAGCNSYSALATETDPGLLEVEAPSATKRMCGEPEMGAENRFLRYLSAVGRYGFHNGQLALFWSGWEQSGAMLFEPR